LNSIIIAIASQQNY